MIESSTLMVFSVRYFFLVCIFLGSKSRKYHCIFLNILESLTKYRDKMTIFTQYQVLAHPIESFHNN